MRKLLSILLSTILLSSCLTVSRIQKNCDEFAKICNTTTTVYRDTTVYLKDTVKIQLPSDTVTIDRLITQSGTQISLEPVSVSKGLISAKAWISANRLMVDAWLNKKYVETVHTDTVTITKVVKETANTVTIREKYIPKFFLYCGYIGIGAIAFFVVFLLLKLNTFGLNTIVSGLIGKAKNLL